CEVWSGKRVSVVVWLKMEGCGMGQSRRRRLTLWVSLWWERRRQSNYRKHPGSDTSDRVPRDRRNPILFRIEGSLTSGSIWLRLSYSVFPVTSNNPIPYSWQVSWIRPGHRSISPKGDFSCAYENHNEIPNPSGNGHDYSDGNARRPGGGTAASTLQRYAPGE